MKKMSVVALVLSLLFVGFSSQLFADEESVVNDPTGAFEKFKAIVNTTKPQGGYLYNLADGDFVVVTSVALYDMDKGSLRIGYGVDDTAVLGLEANLGKVIPSTWPIVPVAAKYIKAGFYGGRDFSGSEWIYGPSISIEVKF